MYIINFIQFLANFQLEFKSETSSLPLGTYQGIFAVHSKSGDSPYRLDRYATVGTEIMFPLRSELLRKTSLELRHNFARTTTQLRSNFDTTLLELCGNFDTSSLELRGNFNTTSFELWDNFARTSTQVSCTTSLELRHNFARTLAQLFAQTSTQLSSNFGSASLRPQHNFSQASLQFEGIWKGSRD